MDSSLINDYILETSSVFFAAYEDVLHARSLCHPPEDQMSITADDVIVSMKALCHHTAERLMLIPGILERVELLLQESLDGKLILELDFKYGCDGLSGCTHFKQLGAEATDSGCVQASHFVLLQVTTSVNGRRVLVYTNPLCNSAISCRVLRYWVTKETEATLKEEISRMVDEEKNLGVMEFSENIHFKFHGILSLLDTKALNAHIGNRCQSRCPICLKLPRELRENPNVIFEAVPGVIPLLCLSILHFLLRSFDHLLKLGYHKKFKTASCYEIHKPLFEETKEEIQRAFKARGITVSKVQRQGGTSNTGNCARRAFEDAEFFATLIEVPVDVVEGIWVIHVALASTLPLDPDKFQNKCLKIRKSYMDSVGKWCDPNPTLFKVLDHGHLVLRLLPRGLTAGQLNEEAPEANNKDIKSFQVNRACQSSQLKRIKDTVFRIQDRSCPYILDLLVGERMKKKRRSKKAYPQAVLDLVADSYWSTGTTPNANNAADDDNPAAGDSSDSSDEETTEDLDDIEEDFDQYAEEERQLAESLELLEQIDGIPDDERGLGEELVNLSDFKF